MSELSSESRGSGATCEWAVLMRRGQALKSDYAQLCLDAQLLVGDSDTKHWLTAEAEMADDVARTAGQIVDKCAGCSGEVRAQATNECPDITRMRIGEWFRMVGPMRYMGGQSGSQS